MNSNVIVVEIYRSREFQTFYQKMHHIKTIANQIHFATNSVVNQLFQQLKLLLVIIVEFNILYNIFHVIPKNTQLEIKVSYEMKKFVGSSINKLCWHQSYCILSLISFFEDLKQIINLIFEQVRLQTNVQRS
ncbi:unnamed protein product [Paramecium sonneborni]|uniref:Uncharacterized protein n=1 Tax=Paramecium sonneborni TaxID=65129 RepID=A0A8S1M131_9CILI|nr:unnamed protein product [Paramecium sonneborni]